MEQWVISTLGVLVKKVLDSTMKMSATQEAQEEQYRFPYHYIDVALPKERDIGLIEYKMNLQFVAEQLSPFEGQRILDVGCGDGRFGYELRGRNIRYEGTDYSERAVAFARAFCPEWTFHAGTLTPLITTHAGVFDQIVLIEVLEHIPPDEVSAVLRQVSQLLKTDGRLIVTVPSTLVNVSAKHYQHFDSRSLRDVLDTTFDVENVVGMNVASRWKPPVRFAEALIRATYPLTKGSRAVSFVRGLIETECRLSQTSPETARCVRLMAVCKNR